MNTQQFDYGARSYSAPSNPYFNLMSIAVLAVHHSSHHHEHPAH